MSKGSTNEGARNCEKTALVVSGNGPAQEGVVALGNKTASVFVDVSNANVWPLLAEKSKNFTGYSVRALRFIYQAVKGSAYNGQITCGFTKDPNFTAWSDADAVINLPAAMRFQASETQVIFEVPTSLMSQVGQALFNPATVNEQSIEPTRYYAGQFGFVAEQCSDNSDIGTWHVEYQVVLEQSQLNLNPGATQFSIDTGAITVVTRGWYCPILSDDHTSVQVTSVRPALLLVLGTHGDREVTLNGELLTPVVQFTEACIFALKKLTMNALAFPGTSITGAILVSGSDPGWSELAMATTTTARVSRK